MSKLISHASPTLSTCTSVQSHTLATFEKAIASADIILHTRENGFCTALTRLLVKNNNIITASVVRDWVHIAKLLLELHQNTTCTSYVNNGNWD